MSTVSFASKPVLENFFFFAFDRGKKNFFSPAWLTCFSNEQMREEERRKVKRSGLVRQIRQKSREI